MAANTQKRGIVLYINGKEINNDIRSITSEMAKLINAQRQMTVGSDEYVAHSRHIRELDGMIAAHRQQLHNTSSAWDKLKEGARGLLPAFGFVAIAAGATSALNAIKNSTHATADAFEFAMAGMSTGLDFFWKTLATGDWSNFFTNLGKAIKGGYEYASMLDEVADNNRALRIIESKARGEELRLEEDLKNKQLSPERRLQAGKDRIALEKKLSIDRQTIANKNYKAEFDEATRVTKLSEDQLLSVAGVIDSEQKLQASAYSKKIEDYEKLKKLNVSVVSTPYGSTYKIQKSDTQEMINLKNEIESTEASVKNYAGFLKSYDVMAESQQDKLISAVELRDSAINSAPENLKKVITKVNSLKAEINNDENDSEKKSKKASEEAQKLALESVEARNKKEVDLINKRHLTTKNSEAQHNAELLAQEFNYLKEKRDVYKEGSKEYNEINAQISDKLVKTSDEVNTLLLRAEKELKDAKIANLQDGIEKEKAIEEQRWEDELTGLKKRLDNITGTSTEEIALRKAVNDLILENEKAHKGKMKILNSADDVEILNKKHEKTEGILNAADEFAQSTPWLVPDQIKDFFAARKSVLEQAYAEEQALAGDDQAKQKAALEKYNREIFRLKQQEIEVTYDAALSRIEIGQNFLGVLAGLVDQESALGKAIFLFQQGLAIASIWVNVAKANGKAIGALGPLAAPVIAANTLMGTVQTALIVAQTVASFVKPSSSKKSKGHAEGGYTGDGGKYEEAGIVHRGEYVIPQEGVNNPMLQPWIQRIEDARRNHQLSRLQLRPETLTAFQSGTASSRGYADGGHTAQVAIDPVSRTESTVHYPKLIAAIDRLNTNIEQGIRAEINKYGVNSLSEAMDSIKRFNSKIYKK